jgi:hypothetical protein
MSTEESTPPTADELYDLVYDAVRQALADEAGGTEIALSKRMVGGAVLFRDSEGRTVKEVDAFTFFRKVTSIRDKLRVLEQKLNGMESLPAEERAELQAYVTRCYGSLTTFNFLFRDEDDKFKGMGGE